MAVGNNPTPALGAPGPENLASPIQRNAVIKSSLIDPNAAPTAPPNRIRSAAGANPTNAAFGTLDIRRKFTNTTDATVTALRFLLGVQQDGNFRFFVNVEALPAPPPANNPTEGRGTLKHGASGKPQQ